jgi:hypothetical protein
MSIKPRQLTATVFVCLLGAIASHPAAGQSDFARQAKQHAEAAVGQVRDACASDAKSFCGTVTPGEGRIALCLLAHEHRISNQCVGAFFDVADRIELAISNVARATSACEPDAVKLCSSANSKGELVQCMQQNKSNLSAPCSSGLADIENRLQQVQPQPSSVR